MHVDTHKTTVHIVGQTCRHVAMAVLLVKLSHGLFGSMRSYMIQHSEINRGPLPLQCCYPRMLYSRYRV